MYKITVSNEQARVLMEACEIFSRLGIGQCDEALRRLPVEKVLGWYADMRKIKDIISPHLKSNLYVSESDETKYAWDLYQVIRHRVSWDKAIADNIISLGDKRNWSKMLGVQYDEPMNTSGLPLAKIEKSE